MKKLTILFVLCFAITLTGCSKEEPAKVQKPEVQPATQAAPVTKTVAEEAKQVAAQAEEKVAQVVQQVEKKAVAAVEQVKSLISGQVIYTKACLSCHKSGILGAPKVGDKSTWAPLIAEGRDEMVNNAIKGVGRMPAKGGVSSLSDEEVAAAVDYMMEQSR